MSDSDHRRLQRALFRMQMDPGFAARIFAGDPSAAASTGLGEADLTRLRELDPLAVAADPGERRKRQLLGNLASEYGLTALLLSNERLEGFLSSSEFHAAISSDTLLPVAFGGYAERTAQELADESLASLVRLELAMVLLRRRRAEPPKLAADDLVLSPRAALATLRDGTLAWAAALRDAAERGATLPRPRLGAGEETVLLIAAPAGPHELAEVRPERLAADVAELLMRARQPLDAAARGELAQRLGASAAELESFADSLVADGALVRGAASVRS